MRKTWEGGGEPQPVLWRVLRWAARSSAFLLRAPSALGRERGPRAEPTRLQRRRHREWLGRQTEAHKELKPGAIGNFPGFLRAQQEPRRGESLGLPGRETERSGSGVLYTVTRQTSHLRLYFIVSLGVTEAPSQMYWERARCPQRRMA